MAEMQAVSGTKAFAAQRTKARRKRISISSILFVLTILAMLGAGWMYRGTEFVTARHGLGYWCGIVGASMMAMLLIYPLRKRIRWMRSWGPMPTWFRWHMAFGLLGPALVIVHSNYEAHSMNAWVALMAMLIVAGSGIVGRYLYVRIHRGLYGAKLEARELMADAMGPRAALSETLGDASRVEAALQDFEGTALAPAKSLFSALWKLFMLGGHERRVRRALAASFEDLLKQRSAEHQITASQRRKLRKEERKRVDIYLRAVRKATGFAVYERLFALWHVLHLPLIALLLITAIIHIIAVNLY